jgi:ATP-dependent Zn protease
MSIAEFDIDSLIELTKEEQVFADRLLDECQERADQIVAERWSDIEKIAAALLDRNVLNADDLDAILKGPHTPGAE